MADETLFFKWLLQQRRRAQHGMEDAPVIDHREDGLLLQRLPFVLHQPAAQFQNQVRDVDLARADLFAVTALDAEALNFVGLLQRVEPRRQDGADATHVNLAENVPADQPVDRADIQARPAADTLERLPEPVVLGHLGPVVIHQDDVQILERAVRVRRRTRDHRDVTREQLSRRAARQSGEYRDYVGDVRDEFLYADDGDMDFRHRRD